MKITMGPVSSSIEGSIKIPKKEIQALEREVLLPLRAALSFSRSADKDKQKLAVEAAVEVNALAQKLCLVLIQVPTETLAQIPNIQKGFPATMSLNPEVMGGVKDILRKLKIGNPKARSNSDHPAMKVAQSNLRVMRLLQNPSWHVSLPGKRLGCPFIHEIDALPPFGPESVEKWWKAMKKLYDLQANNKSEPLGSSFKIDHAELLKLVKSDRSNSRNTSKQHEIRSKYLEKIRIQVLLISRN